MKKFTEVRSTNISKLSIGNHMISSTIWNKSARINFSKTNKIAQARREEETCSNFHLKTNKSITHQAKCLCRYTYVRILKRYVGVRGLGTTIKKVPGVLRSFGCLCSLLPGLFSKTDESYEGKLKIYVVRTV